MGKTKEQRAEKRLRYRWHTRFALDSKQKSLSGQMVDVSSKGMALLYHADKTCPKPNQSITTNFGVPVFDSDESFDTVLFNRIGRVCRVDNLTSKVNRIAVQFAEPLFFKPGEQNISDTEVKQRLDAKAQSIIAGKEKTTSQKQTKTDSKADKTEETERLYSEALDRVEEKIHSYAEAKARIEEKLKAEIEAKSRAQEKAKAETKARAKAEAKAKTEARLRAKAEKKIASEAEKLAKIEAELRETKNKSKVQKKKTTPEKDTEDTTKPSGEGVLMDKVDKFIKDRNRIF